MASIILENVSHPNNLDSLINLDNFTPCWLMVEQKLLEEESGMAFISLEFELEFEKAKSSYTPGMP